jgi:hypothetical protein
MPDSFGVFTYGGVGMSITIKNAVFQCAGEFGVFLEDWNGEATLAMDNTVIKNCDYGVYAGAGTITMTNCTVVYNGMGVFIGYGNTNANVDLSGGGNTFACSVGYTLDGEVGGPGIDVYNYLNTTVNASNCAWGTPTPDYFVCDDNYGDVSVCQCLLDAGCVADAGSNGMNAVVNGNAAHDSLVPNDGGIGAIITTNNTLSPFALDAGCI